MIPCGYQAEGTTSPTRSILAQSQRAVQLAQAASRGVGWVWCLSGRPHKTDHTKRKIKYASPNIKRLPGSEEQQYQKFMQHKVIMQKHIYSFSFIADRRVAFDPPVNLSADLGD
jgi:hypothetical protein